MMIARDGDRTLVFIETEIGADAALPPIKILEIIAGMVVLVLGEQEERVLRSQLLFDGGVPFDAIQFVVGPNAVVMLIVQVEGPCGVADNTKLGSQFAKLAVALRSTETVVIPSPRMLGRPLATLLLT